MKFFDNPGIEDWDKLLKRAQIKSEVEARQIEEIISIVEQKGDASLFDFTKKFDGVALDSLEEDITEDVEIDANLSDAIAVAYSNIFKFHSAQRTENVSLETQKGVQCSLKKMPIKRVGLYIPAGSAPLFSTLLMLAIPARIAGCEEVILCSPPEKTGRVHAIIRYIAKKLEINSVFRVGGAQAVAAMAYGTESIPKVDKIFGPGNQFVTLAKQYVTSKTQVAIDMPAGPTELLIIADETANPLFLAADILSQAEHGSDSQVVFISLCKRTLDATFKEMRCLLEELPRNSIAEKALSNSRAILFDEERSAINFSNAYAPEHLILSTRNAETLAEMVSAAGSVFIGNYTPESVGDYASGTNHTLPTNGAARAYSGVSLASFQKHITFQKLTSFGLKNLGPSVKELARAEGLEGHALAVDVRLKSIGDEVLMEEWNVEPRSCFQDFKPYQSARSECDKKGMVYLDANENAYGTTDARYPDPLQKKLRAHLAKREGVLEEHIAIGNGSDELIELLIKAYCEPGRDEIAVLAPGFGMYAVYANIEGVSVKEVALNPDFSLHVDLLKESLNSSVKILFICSPNNPTGNSFSEADLIEVLKKAEGLVVIDEAYIEFSDMPSMLALRKRFPQLVLLRTFSKAWGLAGARVGYMYADEKVVKLINSIKHPYNVSSLNAQAALEALCNEDKMRKVVSKLKRERDRLMTALEGCTVVTRVFPSDGNFLLISLTDVQGLYQYLLKHKVVIRKRDTLLHCENCVRVTVGTEEENNLLVKLIKEYK